MTRTRSPSQTGKVGGERTRRNRVSLRGSRFRARPSRHEPNPLAKVPCPRGVSEGLVKRPQDSSACLAERFLLKLKRWM